MGKKKNKKNTFHKEKVEKPIEEVQTETTKKEEKKKPIIQRPFEDSIKVI